MFLVISVTLMIKVNVKAKGGRVALQTAQAIVLGEHERRVRLLFDSGSHRSFVTEKAVQLARLSVIRREYLKLSTFGQNSKEMGLVDIVRVAITPVTKGKVIDIESYVVPEINSVRNERVDLVKIDYPHLSKLWFSDVCKSKDELEIDILVGADYLWSFQKGRTIRGGLESQLLRKQKLIGCCQVQYKARSLWVILAR